MVTILRASTIPKRYLDVIYSDLGDKVSFLNYYDLRQVIFSYLINESDQFSYYTNKNYSDKFKMDEIIINDSVLQRKWALENNLNKISLDEIFHAQLIYHKPDVFFDGANIFMKEDASVFKKKYNIKYIIAWDGYIGSDFKRQSYGVDTIFTCVKSIKDSYNDLGFNSEILQFGFDTRILSRLNKQEVIQNKVCFSGSISDNVHVYRKKILLKFIKSNVPLNLYISNLQPKYSRISNAQIRALMQMRIADFVDYFKIQQNNNGGVFGMDMYQLLYDNLIQLNIHGDGTQQAGNIRLYEATGVGTLLLTDWKENINEIFIPDEEVIVFKDQNEALKKAAYYLRNEKEAKEISMNGQKRTISNYSAEKRIEQFIRVISNMLE